MKDFYVCNASGSVVEIHRHVGDRYFIDRPKPHSVNHNVSLEEWEQIPSGTHMIPLD
jgi:hypothetical protein